MRGMKKWLPFKSLDGQYEMLEEMKRERRKMERPELSVDEMEEMNRILVSSVCGDVVKVRFYCDGDIRECMKVFQKCDTEQQKLYLDGMVLPLSDLLKIENPKFYKEIDENLD